MKKLAKIILLVIFMSTSTACTAYKEPNSLIKPPILNHSDIIKEDNLNETYIRFLPSGFTMMSEEDASIGSTIKFIDIDNDKINEMLVFIKKDEQKGFMVLKKRDNIWVKEYQKILKCKSIVKFNFLKVFNKLNNSIIVGFIVDDAGEVEYDAYTADNDGIKERYMGVWNKLDIIETPENNGGPLIAAAWKKDWEDYMLVDFIKFDDNGTYLSKDVYKDYKNKTMKYYKDILSDMLKYKSPSHFAWYGMLRTELQSGDVEASVKTLSTIKEIEGAYPLTKEAVQLLTAQVYEKQSNYSEASHIIDSTIAEQKHNQNAFDENSYAAYRQLGYIYLEDARIKAQLSKKSEALELLSKAKEVFKKLDKVNYYNTEETLKIYKSIDLDTVQNEINNLQK